MIRLLSASAVTLLLLILPSSAYAALVSLNLAQISDIAIIGDGDDVVDGMGTHFNSPEDLQLFGKFSETRNGGKTLVLSGGVTAIWGDFTLTSANAVYDKTIGSFYASGSVVVVHEDFVLIAEKLWLDLEDDSGYAIKAKIYAGFDRGDQADDLMLVLQSEEICIINGEFIARDNRIASTPLDPPSISVKTPLIRIDRARCLSTEACKIKLGDFTVFYLPAMKLNTSSSGGGGGEQPFRISFGSTSYLGMFIRTQVRAFSVSGFTNYAIADYFTERGIGVGLLSVYKFDDHAGRLRSYYIYDNNDDQYFEKRYEFELTHRGTVDFGSIFDDIELTAELHRRSDPIVHKDFFRYEWLVEKNPESYINLQRSWDSSSISLLNRMRVNNFEHYTNYSPQLSYALYGAKIGFGEVRVAVGADHLERKNPTGINEPETERFWTNAVYELPVKIADKFVVTPWVGASSRLYSDASKGKELENSMASAGLVVSTRLVSGTFGLKENGDAFRHTIHPRIELLATSKPTALAGETDIYDYRDVSYEELSANLVLTNAIESRKTVNNRLVYSDRFLIRIENKFYAECDAKDDLNFGRTTGDLNSYFRIGLDRFFVIGDFDYDWYDKNLPTYGMRFGYNATDRLSFEWGLRYINDNPWFSNEETTDTDFTVRWYATQKWYYIAEYSRIFTPRHTGEYEDVSLTVVRRGAEFSAAFTFGVDEEGSYFFFSIYPNFAYTIETRLKPQNYR